MSCEFHSKANRFPPESEQDFEPVLAFPRPGNPHSGACQGDVRTCEKYERCSGYGLSRVRISSLLPVASGDDSQLRPPARYLDHNVSVLWRWNLWLKDRPLMGGLVAALCFFAMFMYFFRGEPNRLDASVIGALVLGLIVWATTAWRKHQAP